MTIYLNSVVDDVFPMTKVELRSHIEWVEIKFEPGTRYYTTVIAVNSIGLQTGFSSDGFLIDGQPPTEGVIFNTKFHGDTIFISGMEPIVFTWHGFDDEHSFIKSYFIATEINNHFKNTSEHLKFIDIGLSNNFQYQGHLSNSDIIVAHLKAVDAAGHESRVVTSRPLIVDKTPASSLACNRFDPIEQTFLPNFKMTSVKMFQNVS